MSESSDSDESSTDEEEDTELLETQKARVKVGLIEAPTPRWEVNAAAALRLVAKSLRFQASGYEKLANCVDKTPVEIMGLWLKKNLPASATHQQPGTSGMKRAHIQESSDKGDDDEEKKVKRK